MVKKAPLNSIWVSSKRFTCFYVHDLHNRLLNKIWRHVFHCINIILYLLRFSFCFVRTSCKDQLVSVIAFAAINILLPISKERLRNSPSIFHEPSRAGRVFSHSMATTLPLDCYRTEMRILFAGSRLDITPRWQLRFRTCREHKNKLKSG